MKTGKSALGLLLALLPLLSIGCSTYKQQVDRELWLRELRLQEDCIWRLKWQIEELQQELDAANARNPATTSSTTPSSSTPNRPVLDAIRNLQNPSGGGGGDAPPIPPSPTGPSIDLGRPFVPTPSGKPGSGTGGSGSWNSPRSPRNGPVSQASMVSPAVDSTHLDPDIAADRIELNPALTGEINSKPGEPALSVAIDQFDANGRRVLAPGDVSIVVVDPQVEGREAKIARWDFESDEVEQHVRKNRDGSWLQFDMPWPATPEHNDLRVFVRFTGFDGRRREANLPIDIQLDASKSPEHGWTKASGPALTRTDEPSNGRTTVSTDDSAQDKPDNPPERVSNRPAWSPNR
jgi:hypothetical protein